MAGAGGVRERPGAEKRVRARARARGAGVGVMGGLDPFHGRTCSRAQYEVPALPLPLTLLALLVLELPRYGPAQ